MLLFLCVVILLYLVTSALFVIAVPCIICTGLTIFVDISQLFRQITINLINLPSSQSVSLFETWNYLSHSTEISQDQAQVGENCTLIWRSAVAVDWCIKYGCFPPKNCTDSQDTTGSSSYHMTPYSTFLNVRCSYIRGGFPISHFGSVETKFSDFEMHTIVAQPCTQSF